MNQATAVSLFSNCGAGDVGYAEAGFRFLVMAELVRFRLDVALLNHPSASGIHGDLRKTLPRVVQEAKLSLGPQELDLLAACPPCQGMSSARGGRGPEHDATQGSRDDRNLLVSVVAEATEALHPKVLVVENVPAFLRRKVKPADQGPVTAARYLVNRLGGEYACFPLVAELADFGVPQTRPRAFLTFFRRDLEATTRMIEQGETPYPAVVAERTSIRTALEALAAPPLDSKDQESAHSTNWLHQVPVWNRRQRSMVKAIPKDTGRSAWETSRCSHCGKRNVPLDLAACPNCRRPMRRPIVEEADGTVRLIKGFGSSYRRHTSDLPAATITTASGQIGSDRTIHPWEDRVLSPWECAALQTIPPDFRWVVPGRPKPHIGWVRDMIGEAVPPRFTAAHGAAITARLQGIEFDGLSAEDPRILKAQAALDRT